MRENLLNCWRYTKWYILALGLFLLTFILVLDVVDRKGFNPNEDVCYFIWDGEEKVVLDNDCINGDGTSTIKYLSRPKTPTELEQDYCNSNLEDSERCFCEVETFIVKASYENGLVLTYDEEQWETPTVLDKELTNIKRFTICDKARPKTECEKGNEEYIYDCSGSDWGIALGDKVTSLCINYTGVCREKNPCEKGNPDFVEEEVKKTKRICDEKVILVQSCIPLVDSHGNSAGEDCSKISNMTIPTNCVDVPFIEKTICREKTK